MSKLNWISVPEYAKKVGKTRGQIYLNIRLGKIPKYRIRKAKVTRERLEVAVLCNG